MTRRSTGIAAASVLILAAVVYAFSLNYYYFGRQTDDARHFLAAESLVHGRYVDLTVSGDPPRTDQLPGYPLLILPAAAKGSPGAAQWMSLLFMLGVLMLLFWRWRDESAGFCAAVLTAFHPLSVIAAGSVMTESAYLLFSVGTLQLAQLLARKAKIRPSMRLVMITAALAGFSAWIRPQGAVLILAAAWFLREHLPRREGRLFLVAASGVALLPFLRNIYCAGMPAGYFSELPTSGALGLGVQLKLLAAIVGSNVASYPLIIGRDVMLLWTESIPGSHSVLSMLAGVIVLGVTVAGLKESWSQKGENSLEAVYTVMYLGLHLFWIHHFARYILPLLPFLYRAFFRIADRNRVLYGFVVVILGIHFLFQDLGIMQAARMDRPGENIPPMQTFEWIRRNVPKDAAIETVMQDLVYFYTRRKTVRLAADPDPDAWFMDISRRRVVVVADYPVVGAEATVPVKVEPMRAAYDVVEKRLHDPTRFQKAFAAPGEVFVLYKVLRPEAFEQGFHLLEQAKEAIGRGDAQAAYRILKRAEALHAPLVRLPFYLGTTAMILGQNHEAQVKLAEAVRREPNFMSARINFERMSRK